jgi:hypothetical protein
MPLKGLKANAHITTMPPSSGMRTVALVDPVYGKLPNIPYTPETLHKLIACGHRQFGVAITASWFGTSAQVLQKFFREHPDAKEAWMIAQNQGKGVLLSAQWDAAKAGDSKMLEWLGKQHLGQRDKIETTGPEARPTGARSKLMDAIDAEAERIALERAGTSAPQSGQSGDLSKGRRVIQ